MKRLTTPIVAAVWLGLLATAGCSAQRDSADEQAAAATHDHASLDAGDRPAAPGSHPTTGHRRMVELLAGIATESAAENPFLGEAGLRRLRADLAALGSSDSPEHRWLIHLNMGKHALRLGRVDEAIDRYREAWRMMEAAPTAPPAEYYLRTAYDTGVAYMRLGETQNCVLRHSSDSCLLPIQGEGVHVDQEGSIQAARYFLEVLQKAPPDAWVAIKARWLFNIVHMTLGTYPEGVPAAFLIPASVFESDEAFPRFRDVAPRVGLNTFDLAGGAVAEDFDGDGLLEVVASTSSTTGQLRYFKSDGNGRFTDRTVEAGLVGLFGGLNLTHADYDNDGHPDLLVLRGGWWRNAGMHPVSLLRNDGNGRFTDVTFAAGLGDAAYPRQTGAFADYDNDGDLDLYLGAETDLERDATTDYSASDFAREYSVRAPNSLFRNNGDGTFTDVTATAGVENLRFAKGVAWGDYDGDRLPDIYVSNMGGKNRLYRNNGDGTFTDVAAAAGVELPIASFATWFWDVNNDGLLDLHVNAYGGPRVAADVGSVASSFMGLPRRGTELSRVYLGDGEGGFKDVAEAWNLTETTLPMGANFGDVDNDGWLDVYLATGYPYYEGLMPNKMYRNREGRGFADVTTTGGFGHLQKGHGVVFADLDNDGDQDVFVVMGGAYLGDAYANALFENPGSSNHWIKVRLVGTRSNRSAIGARLRLDIVEGGKPRSIYRHVTTGASFGSHPLRREIGLGSAERVAALEVYWPTSELTQRFENLPVDCMIEIVEGQESYRLVPLPVAPFGPAE